MMLVASAPSAARPASRNRIPPVRRRSEGAGLAIESADITAPCAHRSENSLAQSLPGVALRQAHQYALSGRLQEPLRQPLVVDGPREEHRTDHGRENGHGLAAG